MLDVPAGLSKKEASDHRKALIVRRHLNGMANGAIARQYDVSLSYVKAVIRRFIADVAIAKIKSEKKKVGYGIRYVLRSGNKPKKRPYPKTRKRNRNAPTVEEIVARQQLRYAEQEARALVAAEKRAAVRRSAASSSPASPLPTPHSEDAHSTDTVSSTSTCPAE